MDGSTIVLPSPQHEEWGLGTRAGPKELTVLPQIVSVVHHWYQSFPTLKTKTFVLCPGQCPFIYTKKFALNCPAGVLAGVPDEFWSGCPSFWIYIPKIWDVLSSAQRPWTLYVILKKLSPSYWTVLIYVLQHEVCPLQQHLLYLACLGCGGRRGEKKLTNKNTLKTVDTQTSNYLSPKNWS